MGGTVIFGGTFDPIHHGHLITCRAAREVLGARRVVLVPAGVSPHKLEGGSAAAEHRLAMMKLAIAGESGFEIETMELERAGPSYTIDTVMALKARMGGEGGEKFFLLMGADQLAKLHTWNRVGELLEMVEVAILERPGKEAGTFLGLKEAQRNFSSEIALRLTKGVLVTPQIEISATGIRGRVGRGESIRYLVPEGVEGYIREFGLYR